MVGCQRWQLAHILLPGLMLQCHDSLSSFLLINILVFTSNPLPPFISNTTITLGSQFFAVHKMHDTCTGKLRCLEFQGNGENTSSFPKFEIANYDVTRIHVHEQKCVHFLLNRLSSFRKIGIATKRLYVCNPLCTAHTF